MAASAPQWFLPSVGHNQQPEEGGGEKQSPDRLRPTTSKRRNVNVFSDQEITIFWTHNSPNTDETALSLFSNSYLRILTAKLTQQHVSAIARLSKILPEKIFLDTWEYVLGSRLIFKTFL